MSRIQLPFSFSFPLSCFVSSTSGSFTAEVATVSVPVVGAAVTITSRTTGNPATVWQAETGSNTFTSILTDSGGNVPGWVDPGSYKIVVAPSGSFAGATLSFDAVRGDGVTNIAAGVVDLTQLSSGVNTTLGYVRPAPPVGAVMMHLGGTDPIDADGTTRWLIMDGRTTLSRTTYATLFALIGITYGGSGSTFGIPDMRGRVAVGAGLGAGLTNRTLGSIGGEENHILLTAELASHTHVQNAHAHGYSDSGHTHALVDSFGSAVAPPIVANSASVQTGSGWTAPGLAFDNVSGTSGAVTGLNISINNATASNQNTGSGTAHNNMQPWRALNHIVRVL